MYDKVKASQAFPPNFCHSRDSAICTNVVLEMKLLGGHLPTIHDSTLTIPTAAPLVIESYRKNMRIVGEQARSEFYRLRGLYIQNLTPKEHKSKIAKQICLLYNTWNPAPLPFHVGPCILL